MLACVYPKSSSLALLRPLLSARLVAILSIDAAGRLAGMSLKSQLVLADLASSVSLFVFLFFLRFPWCSDAAKINTKHSSLVAPLTMKSLLFEESQLD